VSADTSPNSGADDVAFSLTGQDRRTEVVIAEAAWLACVSSCRCHARDVTIASVRFEAGVTG
jgi:hypothetical protein